VADIPRVDESPDEGDKQVDPFAPTWHSDMPRVFKGDRTATRAFAHFFVIMLLFVGAVGLSRSDWTSGPVLYGTLEALSTLLAFVVGALALVRFYSKKQETFLFIGTGFLSSPLFSPRGGWVSGPQTRWRD